MSEQPIFPWKPSIDDQSPTLAVLEVSLSAMLAVDAPRTMRFSGMIQGHQVTILIDSGSSHSFVSTKLLGFFLDFRSWQTKCQLRLLIEIGWYVIQYFLQHPGLCKDTHFTLICVF